MYPYLVILAVVAALAVAAATAPASRSKRAAGRSASPMSLRSSIDAEAFVELARSAQSRAESAAAGQESERMAAAVERAGTSLSAAKEEQEPRGAAEAYTDTALSAYITSTLAYNDSFLGQWAIRASNRAYLAAVCADSHLCIRCYWKATRAEDAAVEWIERIRPFVRSDSERAADYPTALATVDPSGAAAPGYPDTLDRVQPEGRANE
ncbi:hypothetical protein [Streptomyces sp. BA2]|uniref:hypothetical protein n=1 Tax=Streptomyces sp. BA2 TaxID=436595 RepID=UPI001369E798|nr:hypothetical protein [Streptomyces sp. BA2]